MKPYSEMDKKLTSEELAESLVFPVDLTKKEREGVLDEFRTIRKKMTDKETPESIMKAQLLQLKFTIEDYLNSPDLIKNFFFGNFLKIYINCQKKSNKEFAKEINVNPTELSQVINRHRKPTEKLIYRLDIHSNKNFPAMTWFNLLEKEREFELLHDSSIIGNEKKHVKRKLSFLF